jgi:hypothetical protein
MIVQVDRTSTNTTLWSISTIAWDVQPQYCTNLVSDPAMWVPIAPFTNQLQTGTNVTSFVPPE